MKKHNDSYIIKDKKFMLFMERSEIESIVKDLAERINNDYKDRTLLCILVLKGSVFFAADLMRALTVDCRMEAIRTSSYGANMTSSGKVALSISGLDIKDKDVLIIEDIVDTGRTLKKTMERLNSMLPKSLGAVTFLSKPSKRDVNVPVKYIGRDIPPVFVIGYGLDYDEQGRHLPDIYAYE